MAHKRDPYEEQVRKALAGSSALPWYYDEEDACVVDDTGSLVCDVAGGRSDGQVIASAPAWAGAALLRLDEMRADRERVESAAMAYAANPVNADDKPESWRLLTELLLACGVPKGLAQ